MFRLNLIAVALMWMGSVPALAQNQPSGPFSEAITQIDALVNGSLAKSGIPSASIAVVKDGRIVYVHAYGNARLEPVVPATPRMRYEIGAISKQFTAAAILLLQEQGRLSLDDKVSKYLPELTRANEISIRQLLSHTSGFQNYWSNWAYVYPTLQKPIEPNQILDTWARKPLNFDPGTKLSYGDTSYVIAGLIAEKTSGMPLMHYMQEKIFKPLTMASVTDADAGKLPPPAAEGYTRYALGPWRPAPKEARGWMYAGQNPALTAEDLAKWDISIIRQSLMKPASYAELETDVLLKNGPGTQYGLGVNVYEDAGRRVLQHGGDVSGFRVQNVVFPDEGTAVVLLTNQDQVSAKGIVSGMTPLLFSGSDAEADAQLAKVRRIFDGLQRGEIDRSVLTGNCNC